MEKKKTYARDGACAVFLDIDGTLIANGKMPNENIEAIRDAQAKGHKVLINTGRSYSFIPWELLRDIRFDGICAGCGAFVKIGDEVISSVALDRDFVAKLADAYSQSKRRLFMEGETACFWVNPKKQGADSEILSASKYPCFEIKDGGHFKAEYGEHKISKVTFWNGDFDERDRALLEQKLRVIVHSDYAETVIYGRDKAVAMQIALDAMGISRENSIAMGDSANDREMLEFAGIGVAMGNARDEIKAICDYVSTPVADGGVAKALREILGV